MIRLTADQQKKGGLIAAFVVLAGGILYYDLRDDSPKTPVAPVVVTAPAKVAPATKAGVVTSVAPGNRAGAAAKNLGTTSAQLDPTLRMEAMLVTESLVYSGSGRNIFSASSVPVEIPKRDCFGAAETGSSATTASAAGSSTTTANRSEIFWDCDRSGWQASGVSAARR